MNKSQQLDMILTHQSITPVFQPIVSLKSGDILGYETLSRITEPQCDIGIEDLFHTATADKKLWELEKLCRFKALEQFYLCQNAYKLFINVDGNIIHDPELKSGYTLNLLKRFKINAENVIFEITELNSIDVKDPQVFVQTIQHYRDQHFQIAIDDYGCGYSGLNRVCTFNPDYLKLDIALIRDIDSDNIKKSAVASTIQFCKENAIRVIAEGIETEAELNTLIQLGVDYGQGYLLSRPKKTLDSIPEKIIHTIKNCQERYLSPGIFGEIHPIGTRLETVFCNENALVIYNKMIENPKINEFFVVNDSFCVCGILTRRHVMEKFGGRYGFNLSKKLTAEHIMESHFLAVDAQSKIESVAKAAMERTTEHIYDSIAVTKMGRYISTVSVKDLLLAAIEIQTKYASDANPLTKLPGNSRIQEKTRQIFVKKTHWTFIYFDLDNFKAYNDAYGFGNGDLMIETLANILKQNIIGNDFCGHIGGDDFVFISERTDIHVMCQKICKEFTSAIEFLYSASDWKRGFIVSQNRNGKTEDFPIASLSIAIISNDNHQPVSLDELFHIIADTKKKSKLHTGHSIIEASVCP